MPHGCLWGSLCHSTAAASGAEMQCLLYVTVLGRVRASLRGWAQWAVLEAVLSSGVIPSVLPPLDGPAFTLELSQLLGPQDDRVGRGDHFSVLRVAQNSTDRGFTSA